MKISDNFVTIYKNIFNDQSGVRIMKTDNKTDEPQWLGKNEQIDLDVRPSLSKGVDPFGVIMQTIAGLNGRILHIISSFETAPLYEILSRQGFEHYAKEKDGVWHIYFYKQ